MNETGTPHLGALPPLAESPTVSIIVAALNEERFIGNCLESLQRQDYPPERLEIIVADGGSGDGTRDVVRAKKAGSPVPISLIDNPDRDAPHGFNAGLTAARGDVVIIFSAHAVADPRFVRESVAALRQTGAAAAGGPIETRGRGTVGRAIAAAISNPFGVGNARFRYGRSAGYVDTIAFAAYRRECFRAVGGFRTDRVLAVDDFFNYEIRRAGGRLWLTPSVRSIYFSRSSVPRLARQYFGYGRAKGKAMTETPGSIQPRHLVPALAVVSGLVLVVTAVFSMRARAGLAGASSIYGMLALGAAAWTGRRRTERASVPLTALMFPVIHCAYGVGTLMGAMAALVRRARARRHAASGGG